MKIMRVALFDKPQGLFIADRGGGTLKLHEIKIFMANPGHNHELRLWLRMFPDLVQVHCEGDWVEKYGVENS